MKLERKLSPIPIPPVKRTINEVGSSDLVMKLGSRRNLTEKQIKSEIALKSLTFKWNESSNEPHILVVDDNEYNIMAL